MTHFNRNSSKIEFNKHHRFYPHADNYQTELGVPNMAN